MKNSDPEATMRLDERIGFLLRAAARAERDGEARVARALRRMADEARPFDPHDSTAPLPAT
jgi:hypothetical protein